MIVINYEVVSIRKSDHGPGLFSVRLLDRGPDRTWIAKLIVVDMPKHPRIGDTYTLTLAEALCDS